MKLPDDSMRSYVAKTMIDAQRAAENLHHAELVHHAAVVAWSQYCAPHVLAEVRALGIECVELDPNRWTYGLEESCFEFRCALDDLTDELCEAINNIESKWLVQIKYGDL